MKKARISAKFLQKKITEQPQIGLVLGSGLGALAETISNRIVVPFSGIPEFQQSTVEGHAGKMVFGDLGKIPVMISQGRVHYYEGYEYDEIVHIVRTFRELGAKIVILTNSSGCANPDWHPGDLMLLTHHFHWMFQLPIDCDALDGKTFHFYDEELKNIARSVAKSQNIILREGALCANTGPTYETPAEVALQREMGASAISMSTVPEVVESHNLGLRVLAISCLTNYASGISETPLTHDEVTQTATEVSEKFVNLICGIVKEIKENK